MDYADILDSDNISSFSNESTIAYHATNGEIALECIKFIICLTGTSMDILMVFIIMKYKNMKKPINIYIMNWLFCDAVFIIIDPAEYRLYAIMRGLVANKEALCILMSCILVIRTLDLMFMIVLLLHWFFERTKIEIFEKHCHKIVAGVWIFGLIEAIFESSCCIFERMYSSFGDYFAVLLLFSMIISLSIIHCMRRCSNPFNDGTALSIALVTSFVLFWMCIILIVLMYHIVSREVFLFFYYTGQVLVYLYPIPMFYLFYTLDPLFAVSVRLLFRVTQPDEATATFDELDEDTDDGEIPSVV